MSELKEPVSFHMYIHRIKYTSTYVYSGGQTKYAYICIYVIKQLLNTCIYAYSELLHTVHIFNTYGPNGRRTTSGLQSRLVCMGHTGWMMASSYCEYFN